MFMKLPPQTQAVLRNSLRGFSENDNNQSIMASQNGFCYDSNWNMLAQNVTADACSNMPNAGHWTDRPVGTCYDNNGGVLARNVTADMCVDQYNGANWS